MGLLPALVYQEIFRNYKEEVLFQINWRDDMTTAHMIRFNGALYDITRIDNFEGYKTGLKLYASKPTMKIRS